MAKPNIPIVGARAEPPEVLTSTKRKPIIGPVHEKLTNDNVKAIKNMLNKPVVFSALLSTASPPLRVAYHTDDGKFLLKAFGQSS